MSAPGLIASIAGTGVRRRAEKGLKRELANAPKYTITPEAFQNQAIAKGQAFGRDRAVQMGQEDITQGAVNASAQAQDVTNSSSALLSTIAQIEANKQANLRGLAADDSAMRNQKTQQLLNVNSQMIDEKDKAWNYNQNMPFQMRVAMYRDKAKMGSEMEMAGVAAQAQTESALISSVGSMVGGMASDENVKKEISPSKYGIEDVMKMEVVDYKYKGTDVDHVGLIAQQLEKVVPEAVTKMNLQSSDGPTEVMAINYNEVVPVLIKAIQDQQKEIDRLRDLVDPLHLSHAVIGSTI